MYMDDHGVPHCHGVYGDYAGSFGIGNGELLAGEMPPRQSKKIKEFILANKSELMDIWNDYTK